MLKKIIGTALLSCTLLLQTDLSAHCQMPCGIYHDDMVYDQIDQVVQTVYKAMSMLNELKFDTVQDRATFVRWVMQKEKECDDAAHLITVYFLQQKIKPGDPDSVKKLVCAHKLLCCLVAMKQNTDVKFVMQFNEDWEKFKLMFHREGYECEMEKREFKELEELRKKHQDAAKDAQESEEKVTHQD